MAFKRDVGIIGGCGHVGLPLALTMADTGLRTVIYDINSQSTATVRKGRMPFLEEDGEATLQRVFRKGTLEIDDKPERLSECKFLVLIIGTPVDEHLNPSFDGMEKALESCLQYLRAGQILILRSTVLPGVSAHVQFYLKNKGLNIPVAFCPERVAQGYSLREFRELPQIISAFDPQALAEVRGLFSRFSQELVELPPMEAELAKLMTNAWRYIQFATVNQFYMIATEHGLDFSRILHACKYKYPRMAGMPGPGFAAGPCLVKDTMQLAAFCQNQFILGHSAMLINEGLPFHLIKMAERRASLADKTVGILGMAFKAESDDARDSLSYKLRKLLSLKARRVLCSDPYVRDLILVPLEEVLEEAEVIFIGVPHRVYRELKRPPGKIWVDAWDSLPRQEKTS
jgi:UDP-N-acetyl-D-mannosaminuronic acid dehydrogenase